MSSIREVLYKASQQGIYFYVKDGRLAYKANNNKTILDALLENVRNHKDEIITYLTNTQQKTATRALPSLQRRPKNDLVPLSFPQQRLWFLDQMGGGSAQYNIPGQLELKGPFNREALARALTDIVKRHHILRTVYQDIDGQPFQVVNEKFNLPLTVQDLSDLDPGLQDEQLQILLQRELTTDFDLSQDLMLRVHAMRMSAHRQRIIFTMHHIASDGESVSLFLRELQSLYLAYCQQQTNQQQPPDIQYADYAVWQRSYLQGEFLDEHLSYWLRQLRELPQVHGLQLDKSRPAQQTFQGKVVRREIPGKLTAEIVAMCESQRVTLFMLLQTAFSLLLARYSGQTDIVMGMAHSGRNDKALESLIGFFVNSLVLRADLSGNPTFKQLLQRNKQVILEAQAHQHLPFEILVEHLNPERNLSYNPLFQVALTYVDEQIVSDGAVDHEWDEKHYVAGGKSASLRTDLDLYLSYTGDKIIVDLVFNHQLFHDETIDLLLQQFSTLLGNIAKQPEEPIQFIPLDNLTSLAVPEDICNRFSNSEPSKALENADCKQAFAPHLLYWRAGLKDKLTPLELPKDFPKTGAGEYRQGLHQRLLDAGLLNQVQQLIRAESMSEYCVFYTLFTVFLYKYSQQKKFIVGIRANRNNALLMGQNIAPDSDFLTLLRHQLACLKQARNYQDIPVEILISKLNSGIEERCNWVNTSFHFSAEPEVTYSEHSLLADTDLRLSIVKSAGHYRLSVSFNACLYESDTVADMFRHFETLCAQVLGSPHQSVSQFSCLTDADIRQQLNTWNNTSTPELSDLCLHELIQQQVSKTPNAIAVACDAEQLSYQQLNQRANQLARLLIQRGNQNGDLVAILIDRSVNMLVAVLAVLKSGAAYLPLDPKHPKDRLRAILSDSAAGTILTHTQLTSVIPSMEQTKDPVVLCLNEPETTNLLKSFSPMDIDRQRSGVTTSDLAYVIYTSGSTGVPKGVMVSHQNAVNYLQHGLQYTHDEITGSVVSSTLVFDATVCSLFIPLCSGKSVDLLPDDDSLLSRLLEYVLDDEDNYLFKLTPAHLQLLLNSDFMQANAAAAHTFVIGGEQLSQSLINAWQSMLPNATFINEYGPTETTVGCAVYQCQKKGFGATYMAGPRDAVPVGKPIANSRMLVLNDAMSLQPPGLSGELYIAGDGVSRGYLKRPSLTASRFVPNPYSDIPGERIYRTGDLVRYLNNGDLEFIERIDNQVKLRGFRIELGEIEAVLLNHADVKEAAVIVSEKANAEKYLVAYVVLQQSVLAQKNTAPRGKTPVLSEEQLSLWIAGCKAFLEQQLPEYMVPAVIVELDKLPLTVNGKVDRNALAGPTYEALNKTKWKAPRNRCEQILCSLWQEILQVENPGIQDNFFSLGGHSLLATRLISAIRMQFNLELPLKTLFSSPTIEALALAIQEQNEDSHVTPLVPIQRTQSLPLSFAQQRLWFIDHLGSTSIEYNMPQRYRLQGQFDSVAFQNALNALVQRHEVLRTCFKAENGMPQLCVVKDASVPLKIHDLSDLSEQQKHQATVQLEREEWLTPFKLDCDLMIRSRLLKLSEKEHVLLYTAHHIASDGWSASIINKELGALYKHFCNCDAASAQPLPLAPLKLQYVDFAHWQKKHLQGKVLEQQLCYWRRQLKGMPVCHNLPLDHPRPALPEFNGFVYKHWMSKDIARKVNLFCENFQVTHFIFLHTLFAIMLSRFSGEQDIVVGSPIAGRTHADVENMVGLFVNSLVLRSDLSDNPTLIELLQRNRQMILDAFDYQHLPFDMLVEEVCTERTMEHNPLFQIVFALHNNLNEQLSLFSQAEQTQNSFSDNFSRQAITTRFDLEFHVDHQDDTLALSWLYSAALFDDSRIESMSDCFTTLLVSVLNLWEKAALDEVTINELDLLSDTQTRRCILQGQATALAEQVYVLDDNLQLIPDCVAGDLYISVPADHRSLMGTGGSGNSDLFRDKPGYHLVNTGHLARWHIGGQLLLSDNDEYLKVAWRNRELKRLEEALVSHPEVREAKVLQRQKDSPVPQFIAYVTLQKPEYLLSENAHQQALVHNVNRHIRSLPQCYLLPIHYLVVETFALDSRGKIDIDALPELPENEYATQYEAPQNKVEESVCELWQELLGIERVGRNDNFFTLGGHSLLVTRFASGIRQEFGTQLPIQTVFTSPIVKDISELILVQLDAKTSQQKLALLEEENNEIDEGVF